MKMQMQMKLVATILSLTAASAIAVAQVLPTKPAVPAVPAAAAAPGPTHFISIPQGDQLALDDTITHMDDLNEHYKDMVDQFEKAKAGMLDQYKQLNQQMESQLAAERKKLSVPDNAPFTGINATPANGSIPAKPAFAFEVSGPGPVAAPAAAAAAAPVAAASKPAKHKK